VTGSPVYIAPGGAGLAGIWPVLAPLWRWLYCSCVGNSREADPAALYRETRERLAGLVAELDAKALSAPVPACPGWAVRDVVAHLAAISEDAIAGKLTGIPTDEVTAAQVERLARDPVAEILALWSACAPQFEQAISARQVWPAVIDIASHEQDIRAAVGKPGARQCAAIRQCTSLLLSWLSLPVPTRIRTEDGDYLVSQDAGASSAVTMLTLSTSRFEAFRALMGRRSRAQLAALDWSGDPSAVLDHLAVFGPAASDIVE
jgi:uncharacterized protein (TIGR03083 family)